MMERDQIVALVREVRHDANNPLTAALGHLQLVLEDLRDADEEVRSSLHTVQSELRRLSDILKRLQQVK